MNYTIIDAIDVSDDNITNGLNLGTNFLVASGDSINDFTGNGALVVSTNSLQLDATVSGGQWSKGKCAPGFNPTGPPLASEGIVKWT